MLKNLLTICLIMLGAISINAQTIMGTVTNTVGGTPIVNHTVYIYSLDSNAFPYTATATTNNNGGYYFSNVPTSINGFIVYTYDCQQTYQSQFVQTNTGTANFIICSGTAIGCQAGFSSTPDSTNLLQVYFSDQSSGNPTSWYWNFGDGTSSTLQNPVHTYLTSGTYNVYLEISSATCADSIVQTIVVGNSTQPCNAAFYSTCPNNLPSNNVVSFFDNSQGNPTSWSWSFGDGTSSSSQNPVHTYVNNGTYTVLLMITSQNCFDSIYQTITVGTPIAYYSLSGAVYANSVPVSAGVVGLFDVISSSYIATALIDSSGGYYFGNVSTGTYNILASPDTNTSIGQNFASTYYGDVIFWTSAANVVVTNAAQTSLMINLAMIPPIVPGNGSISGNVGSSAKSGTPNAIVNLLNNNLQLIATTKTDVNGDYSFANLSYNTYKIWVEIAGKTTTPITVILDANNIDNEGSDFIVTNNTVEPKVTSIQPSTLSGLMNIYPNPVLSELTIELTAEENDVYTFNIYNVMGQLVSSKTIAVNTGSNAIQLNTQKLSQGTYIMSIQNSKGDYTQKMFIK